jgi:hypothetical protein
MLVSKSTADNEDVRRVQFVDRTKFCQLLISRRTLERSDESSVGARGLLDRESATCFMIWEEQLYGQRQN